MQSRHLHARLNSIWHQPPACSLDHLDSPARARGRNCQTDLFCRFEVDDEFKLRCLLHRQISRFGAFQDLVHVNSRAPIEVIEVRPVGHETALIDILLLWVNSRQPVFAGKLDDPLSFGEKGRAVIVIIAPTCFCFAVLKALSKPLGSD